MTRLNLMLLSSARGHPTPWHPGICGARDMDGRIALQVDQEVADRLLFAQQARHDGGRPRAQVCISQ